MGKLLFNGINANIIIKKGRVERGRHAYRPPPTHQPLGHSELKLGDSNPSWYHPCRWLRERERPFAATLATLVGAENVKLCQQCSSYACGGKRLSSYWDWTCVWGNKVNACLGEVACSSDTLVGKPAAAIMGRGLNGIRVPSSSSSKGVREHQLASGQIWGVHDYARDEGRQRLSLSACSSANTKVEEACLLVIATSPHYSEWSPNPTLVKKKHVVLTPISMPSMDIAAFWSPTVNILELSERRELLMENDGALDTWKKVFGVKERGI